MCMVDYGEPPTVYQAKNVAHSRKPRKCDECQRDIAVGEPYRYAFMVCDGQASSWAVCQHCKVCAAWLEAQCGGYLHGGIQEDLEGHVHELAFEQPGSKIRLLRLIVGMRRHWRSFGDPAQLMAVQHA